MMKKVNYKIIKKISNQNITITDNLNLYRTFQKMLNPISKKIKYNDLELVLKNRTLNARVFPSDSEKIIIFFHGGGWVSGCIDSYTKSCKEMADTLNQTVISVEYRLAPEYPFPAPFEDCYDACKYIIEKAQESGIKPSNITIMGDSAGGNLTAAVALKARDTREFKIEKQILLYPALQSDYSATSKYKSINENGKDYLLTRENMVSFVDLYIKKNNDHTNPYAFPLNDKNFEKLPKTMIVTSEFDPLRDEGREYAYKLALGKNDVTHFEYKGAIHGFFSNRFGEDYIKLLFDDIRNFTGEINEKDKQR